MGSALGAVHADSLDKVWIIEENTGSPETMVKLEDPDLSPNQTIEVYIEEKGLSARWGEGFAYYTYTYYSEVGKKIWSSRKYTKKKRTSDDTWTFSHVQRITIPEGIPKGTYRLGFELTDYHTKEVYQGNVHFTVGTEQPKTAEKDSTASSAGGDFRTTIGEIELSLVSVEKSDNRLTFTLKGINTGGSKNELRLYPYKSRIVSKGGEEFVFSEDGGKGTLVSGIEFPPEVPMQATFYFKRPVPSRVSHISYMEIPFYSRDDKIIWRDIPVPWSATD
jgi:hypothetical protein